MPAGAGAAVAGGVAGRSGADGRLVFTWAHFPPVHIVGGGGGPGGLPGGPWATGRWNAWLKALATPPPLPGDVHARWGRRSPAQRAAGGRPRLHGGRGGWPHRRTRRRKAV
eukprot:15432613-Alexandrium_andersonii.AAC.1